MQSPVSCTDMATFFAVSAALGRFYFWTGARGHKSLALLGDIVSLESPVEGPAYNWVNTEYLQFAVTLGLRHLVLPGHLVDSLSVPARNLGIQLLKPPTLATIFAQLPSFVFSPASAMGKDDCRALRLEERDAARRERARERWCPADDFTAAALEDQSEAADTQFGSMAPDSAWDWE
jgi:hypothetical protein